MDKPLVSVLIPVYNAGNYLRASLQSILDQTYRDLEIIIIDDGSTDNCIESITDIKDSRIRIFSQQNYGRAAAMNRGLDELSGDFYIAQDADDISYPCRVQHQLQYITENLDLAAVFVSHDLIIRGKIMAPRFASKNIQQCREDIANFRMPGIGATAMYRMSLVSKVHFEQDLKVGEDVDYVLRIGECHPMFVLGECLYSYRIHPKSSTRQSAAMNQLMTQKVIKRACQRRGSELSEYQPDRIVIDIKRGYKRWEADVVPHFMESVLDLCRAAKIKKALTTASECVWLNPFDPYFYKPLFYFIAPLGLIKYYRYLKAKHG